MIKVQLYGRGVIDYSNVEVYKDDSKFVHADMSDAIVIKLTKGDDVFYIKLGNDVVQQIKDLRDGDTPCE